MTRRPIFIFTRLVKNNDISMKRRTKGERLIFINMMAAASTHTSLHSHVHIKGQRRTRNHETHEADTTNPEEELENGRHRKNRESPNITMVTVEIWDWELNLGNL
jgi:hypothetical protein